MRKQFMHRTTLRFWATVFCLALWCPAGGAAAQEADPAPAEPAEAAPADAAPSDKPAPRGGEATLPGEQEPRLLYLPDENGKLRPVPGFDLEQLIELYKVKNGIEQQSRPPAYSIAEVRLQGSAQGADAGLTAELTADVKIAVHDGGWVRVPLRLANSMLGKPATYEGPGEHMLKVAADGSGYEAWIRSEPDTTHHVHLQLWTPVEQVGAESRLRLNVARAPVAQLELDVPVQRATARVSEGSTLVGVEPGNSTHIKAIGLTGDFELTWQAADTPVARLPTVLEATGAITLHVDGRSINSDAKLTVRSSGGEFDSFRVRLPPGAELIPTAPGATSVVASDDDGRGVICEVKLPRKTADPVEVRLVSQRVFATEQGDKKQGDQPLELAGFEVLDAVRQSGTITVQVAADWQVQWAEMRHIRQTDAIAGLFDGNDQAAVFEYTAKPFSLTARIKPQESHRRVEADYLVLVGANEVELQARLKYTIRGAKVRTLEVDAPGWNIDLLGPGNLVNVDAVIAGQNNPLVIPLLQSTSGEVEVTFAGRQEVDASSGTLQLRLPVPRGDSVAAANVTILPADNVELLVDPEESIDISPQPVRPKSLDLPARQQEPLYFRTAGDMPTISAALTVHRQEISVAATNQVELDAQSAVVRQRLSFQVSYEPTDHLMLGVPGTLRPEQIEITLDGQRLTPMPRRLRDENDDQSVIPMRVSLPEPRIGRCELQLQYTANHEKPSDEASTLVDVPLVVPSEGRLISNELTVVSEPGVSATYPKGPWTAASSQLRVPNAEGLQLTADSALPSVAVAVSIKQRQLDHTVAVEQAWIETRLTSNRRQDRAVFRLATTEPNIRVALPAGAEPSSLEIRLDGRRLGQEIDLSETRELVLPVTDSANDQHVLELRYFFNRRPANGRLELAAPQIRPGGWVQQLYWQLDVPATEHVLGAPSGYAREYRWNWSRLFWHREPSLSEDELASWIGTSPAGAPAGSSGKAAPPFNRYLFSTVGSADPLAVRTISRAKLVLLASLPLLLCGLILIYVPAARHPVTLLVAAVAIAATSAIDPETAVVIAQAASLGLVLAGLAFLLARVSVRPSPPPATPMHGSSQSLNRLSAERFPQGAAGSGSQPSTATNPLVPSSAPESSS